MGNTVYKAAGNIWGVKNYTDGRKAENELLAKSNNHGKMLSRAKSFARNNPFAMAAKITFETYCGCLTPVEGYEESRVAFNEWAKRAGLESGQSLGELAAQLVGTMTWGDCLAVLGSDPYAPPGTVSARLKLIDPLQVETPPKYKNKDIVNGKRVVLGVVLDKHDIEIGYYVRKAGTDGNNDSDFSFLPRYDKNGRFFSMLVRRPGSTFPGQVRSLPMLAAAMDVIDVLDQLIESAAIEAKTKSSLSIMLETSLPPSDGQSWADKKEAVSEVNLPRINLDGIKSGDVASLPHGTTPHVIANAGNLDIVEQIKQQIKLIAGSFGVPYAAMMSDFDKMSFSSSKMMMSKLYTLVDLWNYGPIMRLFNEIYKWVCFEHYLVKGILPSNEMLVCNWVGPEQPDPDPVKSAKANEIRLRLGVENRTDIVARKGDNYEDLLEQKKKELDMEREKFNGLTFDEVLGRSKTEDIDNSSDDEDDDKEEEE